MRCSWSGVFPAAVTHFRDDQSLDLPATMKHLDAMIGAGIDGLIMLGTVGENCSLARNEKIAVIEAARDVAKGRVPVIAGVAEYTTAFAADFAREAKRAGVDGQRPCTVSEFGCFRLRHAASMRLYKLSARRNVSKSR